MAIQRPIIFSTDMVRAILAGKKKQTRRIISIRSNSCKDILNREPDSWVLYDVHQREPRTQACFSHKSGRDWQHMGPCCPHGKPGDKLWLRETWAVHPMFNDVKPSKLGKGHRIWYFDEGLPVGGKWRPSIFMPRWASRITLEIDEIRVERLNEITEKDAKTEGAQIPDVLYADVPQQAYSYRENFRLIWDSINKSRGYSWDLSPWVWIISFSVLSTNGEI